MNGIQKDFFRGKGSGGGPGLLADCALIESTLIEPSQTARFLALHSSDWLLASPIANCGLHLDDEAVQVAIGMQIGSIPGMCQWGRDITTGYCPGEEGCSPPKPKRQELQAMMPFLPPGLHVLLAWIHTQSSFCQHN